MSDTIIHQLSELRREVRKDVRVIHDKMDKMQHDVREDIEKHGKATSDELEKHEMECAKNAKFNMRIIIVLVLLVVSDHEKVGDLLSIALRVLS